MACVNTFDQKLFLFHRGTIIQYEYFFTDAEIVDSNAIILLENAKHRHFINLQQWNYFSKDETSAILKVEIYFSN